MILSKKIIKYILIILLTNINQLFAQEVSSEELRNQKLQEMQKLQSELNAKLVNNKEIQETILSCREDYNSCMQKYCSVDNECITASNGLKESDFSMGLLRCFPTMKICISDKLSDNSEKINIDKLSSNIADEYNKKLSENYSNLMKESCENAGGFYYDGLCGVFATTEIVSSAEVSIDDFLSKMSISNKNNSFIISGNMFGSSSFSFSSKSYSSYTDENGNLQTTSSSSSGNTTEETIILNNSGIIKTSTDKSLKFMPEGWSKITTSECFPETRFKSSEESSAITKALNLANANEICKPYGYMNNKFKTITDNSTKSMFKSNQKSNELQNQNIQQNTDI